MGTRGYDMSTRAAARERTRRQIMRAAVERLADQRYDDVTLAAVADAAGVTVQTVLNHFGSKEGMVRAAAAFFADEVPDLRGIVEPGDIRGAVAALLRQYEVMGDGNWRLAADADRHAVLHELVEGGRAAHRAWLETTFAPLLPPAGPEREDTLAALYAITDVGTWRLLRRDLGRTAAQTEGALVRLIQSLLEGGAS